MSSSQDPPGGAGVAPGDRPEPLTVAEFRAWPRPAGPSTVRLDIAGVAAELSGLPDPLAASMMARYLPWIGPPTGAGRPLKVEVVEAPLDYFIPPAFANAWEVYRVLTAYDGAVFRATSYRLAW